MWKKPRITTGLMLLFMVMLLAAPLTVPAVAQSSETQIAITAPVDGDIVNGLVPVLGTANHPSQFAAYQLWFALSNTEQWFPINSTPVQTPVNQGELGQWNASALPPGEYQLRLRVFLNDGSFEEVFVQSLTVDPNANTQQSPATAVPTSVQFTGIPPTDIPTLAAAADDSAAIGIAGADVADSASGGSSDESSANFTGAFCTGAVMGVGLFLLMGMYTVFRSQVRGALRRFMAGLDDE